MDVVTVKELLEATCLDRSDLKRRVKDEDLNDLSVCISNSWENYATFLGLKEGDIEDIRSKGKIEKKRMFLALQRWKQMYAFKATFERLVIKVLLKNDDAETAEKVCNLLKGKYPPHT